MLFENVDQLRPEHVGHVITYKIVEDGKNNPTRVTSHITGKLVAYTTAVAEYTQGNPGTTSSYQIFIEGYPVIKGTTEFKPLEK